MIRIRTVYLGIFGLTLIYFAYFFQVFYSNYLQFLYLGTLPFFVLSVFMVQKIPKVEVTIGIMVYSIYWSLIIILGTMFYTQKIVHLVQLSLVMFIPCSFYLIGLKSDRRGLAVCIGILTIITLLFTMAERLEFFLGIKYFGALELSSQIRGIFSSMGGADIFYNRATGFFDNPNTLGFVSGLLFFSALILKDKFYFLELVLVLSSAFTLIVLSISRGSLVAFSLSLILYFIISRDIKNIINFSASFFLIIGLFYFMLPEVGNDIFFDRFFFTADSSSSDESFSARTVFWWEVYNDLDITLGTWYSPELALGHAIDNLYFRYLAQGGVMGLLVSIFLILCCISTGSNIKCRMRRASFLAMILFVIMNSMTMISLATLFSALFWLILGIGAQLQVES